MKAVGERLTFGSYTGQTRCITGFMPKPKDPDEDEDEDKEDEDSEEEDDGADLPDKEIVFEVITELVTAFLRNDRKKDEDLPKGALQEMIEKEVITVEEIVDRFREELEEQLDEG
jgi:hypothetical protein